MTPAAFKACVKHNNGSVQCFAKMRVGWLLLLLQLQRLEQSLLITYFYLMTYHWPVAEIHQRLGHCEREGPQARPCIEADGGGLFSLVG